MGGKILVFLYSFFLISCVSVSTLDIQVLEPASDPVTPDITSVVLLNRAVIDEKYANHSLDSVYSNHNNELYNQSTTEIIFSLAQILNESPGIDFLSDDRLLEIPGADPSLIPDLLDPSFVIFLCDSMNANAIITLEGYDIIYSDTLNIVSRRNGAIADSYYLGEVNANITSVWRIYEQYNGGIVDEHVWLDTLVWQFASYSMNEIPDYLPSLEEVLLEAAYYTALTYARRISPYWINQERYYFARGNRNLRLASNLLNVNRLDDAEIVYKSLLDSRNKNIVASSKFNLSLIYEMRGDYRQALNMARRSFQIRRHPVSVIYLEILEDRLEKSTELDRQLGRIN